MNFCSDKSACRDWLAVLLVAGAAAIGLYGMMSGETAIVVDPESNMLDYTRMLPGLSKYCIGFGAILIATGIAYILLGYKDKTQTNPNNPSDDI